MAYVSPPGRQLHQGDILKGVRAFELSSFDGDDVPLGVLRDYNLCIVVTQDCDLEQDFKSRFSAPGESKSQDKLLFGVLMCGVYEENLFKAGSHREGAKAFAAKEWKAVRLNQDPRYQYLGHVSAIRQCLVADFKDYFMVPTDFLYAELDTNRVGRVVAMESPWKQHVLQRFAWYIMRVGLPTDFHMIQADTSGSTHASDSQAEPLAG